MTYRIHPAIGVARVGDSEEYYIAPEKAAGLPILPDGKAFTPADFRDARKRVRRQGARFTVYRYDGDDSGEAGVPVRAGEDGVARIEWTVHLANKKASWYEFNVNLGEYGYGPDHPLRNANVVDERVRTKLIIDPGPRTLTRPNQSTEFSRSDNPDKYRMTWPPRDLKPWTIDSLGGLRTDDRGDLIVLGGHGHSGTTQETPKIVEYANNDQWWDDTSDGPVTARVVMEDGSAFDVETSSWVIVAPPRFAPELLNLVTLYDTIYDVAVRLMEYRPEICTNGLWQADYRPSWEEEIEPILQRANRYPWVAAIPPHPHKMDFVKLGDPDPAFNPMRTYYLEMIRPPDSPNLATSELTGQPMMPFLAGDNCLTPESLQSDFATVTRTQYFVLQQWAAGRFRRGGARREPAGRALDRAALENCVGAAFSPGIEMTWICRDTSIYTEPFRIRRKPDVPSPLSLGQDFAAGLEPGDLARYMAVPWQADFNECSSQPIGDRFIAWWWPVQRPNYVYVRKGDRKHQVPWLGTDKDQRAADYIQFGDDLEMVKMWPQLGFVFNEGTDDAPDFVEVERVLPRHGRGSAT